MRVFLIYFICFLKLTNAASPDLPTLYEYYTGNGVTTGLSVEKPYFTLNEKNITIFSGNMDYFKIHPAYWRDRLQKLRASGLIAVTTSVPWNLHEPQSGIYDFGEGGTDFEIFLDIKGYLKIAQEEDLLVIIRAGPYIDAELEFGGMPSWLLRDHAMRFRTSHPKFMTKVERYFKNLFEILTPLQFTKGGPIIAFQIENEYGSARSTDKHYLKTLKDVLVDNNVVELLFTADPSLHLPYGTVSEVFATVKLLSHPVENLRALAEYQPNKPSMVMEYFTGWYDHWTETHHILPVTKFVDDLKLILEYPASFNIYMFHGGTNWGLLNGASINDYSIDNAGYIPIAASNDFDAPLSEAGDYTEKYFELQKLLSKYSKMEIATPPTPKLVNKIEYQDLKINLELPISKIVDESSQFLEEINTLPMEYLNINNDSGQSYGYIVYRKRNLNISAESVLKISGRVCDTVMVLINGELKSRILETQEDLNKFGYWRDRHSTLNLGEKDYVDAELQLIVENWGRNSFGNLNQFNQLKGLWQGDVLMNEEVLTNWDILPLEFKKSWSTQLQGWQEPRFLTGPTLYKSLFTLDFDPPDTFLDMSEWNKGIVIVNGFVLSRYLKFGPQRTIYLPGPFLKQGLNDIIIFEHFEPAPYLKFVSKPIYEKVDTLQF